MLIKNVCCDAYNKCVLMLIKKVLPEIQRKWVITFVITLLTLLSFALIFSYFWVNSQINPINVNNSLMEIILPKNRM